MSRQVLFERDGQAAQVLVVRSRGQQTHRGVFIRREVDSVRRQGVGCDVMEIAGSGGLPAYGAAVWRLLRMNFSGRRYVLVHAHGGEAALAARFYVRAPLVVSYQGSDLLGARDTSGAVSPAWRLRRTAIRLHAHLVAATITKSEELERALPPGVRASNAVIPNGVDLGLFRPLDRDSARAELGWDPAERVILFAADPSRPGKRIALARAAYERVRERLPQARLEVASGVPPDRMPVYMNASDCLLHPSAGEGSSNVVKEALACNLPIVATPVGDIPWLLARASDSYVCDADAEQLAERVKECIDPPRRSDAREHVAFLDEASIAERIVAVYRSVATLKPED